MKTRIVVLLSLLFVLSLGLVSQAYVAIDDDFDGDAGTVPNPAIWITTPASWGDNPSAEPRLDGLGNVVGNTQGWENLVSIGSTYGMVPTATEFCKATFENVSPGTTNQVNLGVNGGQYFVAPRLMVRADIGGGFYGVDITNPGQAFTWWTTDVPYSESGTWVIDWYTDKVKIYFNGDLKFDSTVNTVPTVGDSSWTIPSAPMFPEIGGGHGMTAEAGYFSVDRIAWETVAVPEPVTMSLLAVGGIALLRRRGA